MAYFVDKEGRKIMFSEPQRKSLEEFGLESGTCIKEYPDNGIRTEGSTKCQQL